MTALTAGHISGITMSGKQRQRKRQRKRLRDDEIFAERIDQM